jgi:C_GCAxxG_C_C family probable redox protein
MGRGCTDDGHLPQETKVRGTTRRSVLKNAGICAAALAVFGMDDRAVLANPTVHAPKGAALPSWAAQRFLSHWNCTQAVMEAFAHDYGCDMATAQRISTAFAGGMCQGVFCGSFSGAFMVIGLAYGKVGAPDKEVAGRVRDISSAMSAQFGSLSCSSLLGVDMSTPEGVQLAGKRGLYKTFCPKLVEATVRKIQEIL